MSKYDSYLQEELQPHIRAAKKRAAAYHMLKQAVRDRIDNDMIPLSNLLVGTTQEILSVSASTTEKDIAAAIPDGKPDVLTKTITPCQSIPKAALEVPVNEPEEESGYTPAPVCS